MAASTDQEKWSVPTYKINVSGVGELTHDEPKGMDYTMVEDHIDMIGVAELSFKAPEAKQGGAQIDWSSVQVGADVEITLGHSSRKVFVGTVVGTKHGHAKGRDSLTLKCMDPLAKIMASRNTQTWEDGMTGVPDSDIVSEILGRYGVAGTVDTSDIKMPYTTQRNESDYHFLRRLAARNGFILTANEGMVDFKKPQYDGGIEIMRDKVISLDYNESTRSIPQKVRVISWDYLTKKKIEAEAGPGDIQSIGSGGNMVAEGGQTYSGEAVISDVWCNSQEMAKAMAVAELNRLARMGVKGKATVQGDGNLHAGAPVNFKDQKAGFNPEVFIVSSRHRISNKSGFVTELTFCSNTKPA